MSQAKEIIEHTVKNWPTNHDRIKKSVNFSINYYGASAKDMKEYRHYIDFDKLSESRNMLDKSVVEEFSDKLNFSLISKVKYLPEYILLEYGNKIDWTSAIRYQRLTENVMEERIDKLDFKILPVFQKLSENFVAKYRDKFDMDVVMEWQNFSNDFRKKMGYGPKKIDKNNIIELKQIPGENDAWYFYDRKLSGFLNPSGRTLHSFNQWGQEDLDETVAFLNGLANLSPSQLYALDPSEFDNLENLYLREYISFACYGISRSTFHAIPKLSKFKKPGKSINRRGRPPKNSDSDELSDDFNDTDVFSEFDSDDICESKPVRKRGRPKKEVTAIIEPSEPVVKRPRGRPRKTPAAA